MRNLFTIILLFISVIANAYSLSAKGKTNIRNNESCRLTAYWDSNGWSIGYGHHGSDVKKGQKISQARANQLFNQDVAWVNESINRLIGELPVKHQFSQNFIDGLGDLIYNCGENGVRQSTFFQRLKNCRKNNKQDMAFTIAAVKSCRVSLPGHIERRKITYKLMLA